MGLVSVLETLRSRISAAWAALASGVFALWKAFDIRDLLVYGGLLSIGYGLYQLFPWLGWTVFGLISMLLGLGWLFRVRK
ncbi:MAG: hypothetical protein WC455_22960 [Dehalococcoidia bacterium]|jgi:hypothetical protein